MFSYYHYFFACDQFMVNTYFTYVLLSLPSYRKKAWVAIVQYLRRQSTYISKLMTDNFTEYKPAWPGDAFAIRDFSIHVTTVYQVRRCDNRKSEKNKRCSPHRRMSGKATANLSKANVCLHLGSDAQHCKCRPYRPNGHVGKGNILRSSVAQRNV